MGVNFKNKYKTLAVQMEKSNQNFVKLEVQNFEHLR